MASLMAHAQYFRFSRQSGLELTEREKDTILYVMEEAYRPAAYTLPFDFGFYDHFLRCVRKLEFSSSPGYPYCLGAPTIGDWLGWDGIGFDSDALDRLWYDVQKYFEEPDSVYRVFVKDEPHKMAKAVTDRWRLIICPPLYEQVAWSMLFGQGNDAEIRTIGETPSFQGIKLCNGGWKDANRKFREKNLTVALDKSAWDWTCHIEWLWLDLQLRDRLITATASQKRWWRETAQKCYEAAFERATLMLSNGEVFKQIEPGVMKSGCINTISTNSHAQIFVHILLCLRCDYPVYPLPVAVGDDVLSAPHNVATAGEFAQLGVIKKDGEEGGTEFVGHVFHPYLDLPPRPAYREKHFYRFLQMDGSTVPEYLESMAHLYAHDDDMLDAWRDIASHQGVILPSKHYLRYWYNFPTDIWEPAAALRLRLLP